MTDDCHPELVFWRTQGQGSRSGDDSVTATRKRVL